MFLSLLYNPGNFPFCFTGSSYCPAADGGMDNSPILKWPSVDYIPVHKDQEARPWFAVPALLVGGKVCQPAGRWIGQALGRARSALRGRLLL